MNKHTYSMPVLFPLFFPRALCLVFCLFYYPMLYILLAYVHVFLPWVKKYLFLSPALDFPYVDVCLICGLDFWASPVCESVVGDASCITRHHDVKRHRR